MSATMNTKEFLPALTMKYLTIDEGDEVEVEQYDLKTAAIIVDRNGEGWDPSSKSETGLAHRPVARAITLSSVH